MKIMKLNSCILSVASERSSNVKFPIFFSAELQIRQNDQFYKAEFLRPYGSKRTKFERGNSAERVEY